MAGRIHSNEPLFITAEQAADRFQNETYITGFNSVMEAIKEACLTHHSCVVNIPTGRVQGDSCSAYYVMKKLCRLGYDVVMQHDSENGSTELAVTWGK